MICSSGLFDRGAQCASPVSQTTIINDRVYRYGGDTAALSCILYIRRVNLRLQWFVLNDGTICLLVFQHSCHGSPVRAVTVGVPFDREGYTTSFVSNCI